MESDSDVLELLERVGDLIPLALEQQVASRRRRREIMGRVWQDCYERVRGDPSRYAGARDHAELEARVAELVRTSLAAVGESGRGATVRSGSLGTFVDPQLRALYQEPGGEPAGGDESEEAALERHPLVADAFERARAESNATLARNLRWMLQRDEGLSYEAIAAEGRCPTASVRTGVRRARQAVRRIAQEKRRDAHAPHQGKCPPALAPAREAWKDGRLEAMECALAAARPQLERHPYYQFLLGLWADDSGDRERAVRCFERVLLVDDDSGLRAKVLNCLGYVADDRADRELAHFYWSRSIRVDPHHTPAHVNLLKSACDRRDKLELHICIDRIGELLASRALRRVDEEYLVSRLREHPDLEWARGFEAWQRGPARWIARRAKPGARHASREGAGGRLRHAGLVASLAALAALGAARSTVDRPSTHATAPRARAAREVPAPIAAPGTIRLAGGGDRGGLTSEGSRPGTEAA